MIMIIIYRIFLSLASNGFLKKRIDARVPVKHDAHTNTLGTYR